MSPRGKSVLRALAEEEHAALQAPRLDLRDLVREPLLDCSAPEVVGVLAREVDVVVRVLLHGRVVGWARAPGDTGDVQRDLGELILHLDPLRLGLVMPRLTAAGGQDGDQQERGQASHHSTISLSLRRTRSQSGWRALFRDASNSPVPFARCRRTSGTTAR